MQSGIAANPLTASPVDADTSPAGENSLTDAGATVDAAAEAADEAVGKGFFLLVLKNGMQHQRPRDAARRLRSSH
jgi:hypothetical protein